MMMAESALELEDLEDYDGFEGVAEDLLDDELALEGELLENGYGDGFSELEDFALEAEDYMDFEGDEFLGWAKKAFRKVGGWVKKGVKWIGKHGKGIFKVLAPIAARVVGGVIGGPIGAQIGGTLASAVMREAEYEGEAETESELYESEEEFEASGGDWESYEAMEEYAAQAAEAVSEAESDRHIARMAWSATRMYRSNRRVRRAIPRVIRAALALAKTFRLHKRTRWAIKAIPVIVRRTLVRLNRMPVINKRAIVEAMARETAWVLANRRRASTALRRHHMVRRRVVGRSVVGRSVTGSSPASVRTTTIRKTYPLVRTRHWPTARHHHKTRFYVPVYAFKG